NFHDGINLYRFLADLQSQEHNFNVQWDWGVLKRQKMLPRVTYKNLILSRARWHMDKIQPQIKGSVDKATMVEEIRKKYSLPEYVVLTEGDNELFLDLKNPLCTDLLITQLYKSDIVLQEALYTEYHSPVNDQAG